MISKLSLLNLGSPWKAGFTVKVHWCNSKYEEKNRKVIAMDMSFGGILMTKNIDSFNKSVILALSAV